MARDWTRVEVEATVADYFEMLASELRGESYNKAAHRRALSARLEDRSHGAIERKHQNISATLIDLGHPYIDGYKPLSNYQQLLFEVVEERMQGDGQLVRLVRTHVESEQPDVPTVADILERLVSPPSTPSSKTGDRVREGPRRRRARRVDYLAMEARNSSLGRAGEEFVVNFERARLIHEGRETLADRVEHVAVSEGDGLGFDVLSFEASGADRLIEVKTTAYGIDTPFYVTTNELDVSRERSDAYQLYRPFRFRTDPRLFTVPGALETTCALLPIQYRARVL